LEHVEGQLCGKKNTFATSLTTHIFLFIYSLYKEEPLPIAKSSTVTHTHANFIHFEQGFPWAAVKTSRMVT
jgi:hypothetical protein